MSIQDIDNLKDDDPETKYWLSLVDANTETEKPFIVFDLPQQSKAWHNIRKTRIGASDAIAIMGVSPWSNPAKLLKEKKTGVTLRKTTKKMERGIQLEEIARQHLSLQTGIHFQPAVAFKDKWAMASLDGINIEKNCICEIKCPDRNGDDHAKAMDGKVPDKYYPQLQHQMAVTGFDLAYYFSFDGIEGVIVEVKKDDEYIEKLLKAEKEFYQCMIDIIPPTSTEKKFLLREDQEWLESVSQCLPIIQEIQTLEKQLKVLKEKEAALKEGLIKLAGQSNTKGGGLSLSKTSRKGTVDYAAVPELNNIDLEQYRKPAIEYWSINTY